MVSGCGTRRSGARLAGARFTGARFTGERLTGARRGARAGFRVGRFFAGLAGFFRRVAGFFDRFAARAFGLERPGRAAFRFFAINPSTI